MEEDATILVPSFVLAVPEVSFLIRALLVSDAGEYLAAFQSMQDARKWLRLVLMFRDQSEAINLTRAILQDPALSDEARLESLRRIFFPQLAQKGQP